MTQQSPEFRESLVETELALPLQRELANLRAELRKARDELHRAGLMASPVVVDNDASPAQMSRGLTDSSGNKRSWSVGARRRQRDPSVRMTSIRPHR